MLVRAVKWGGESESESELGFLRLGGIVAVWPGGHVRLGWVFKYPLAGNLEAGLRGIRRLIASTLGFEVYAVW